MRRSWASLGWRIVGTAILLVPAAWPSDTGPGFGKAGELAPSLGGTYCVSSTYRVFIAPSTGSGHDTDRDVLPQVLAQNRGSGTSTPDQPPGEEKLDLNDQVIKDVFEPLQRGINGHNLYQVLAVFDQDGTPDYAEVRDQLRAFFDGYDAIRFRYQLLQVTSDKNHAFAVAEIVMEATPADPSQVTLRRETQMRFRMNLGPKSWKLVGFSPANFLTQ